VWAFALGFGAATASAASIDALGPQGDAVEDTPWVLAASGRAEGELRIYARIKPVGGRPCGPNDASDDGTLVAAGEAVSGAWTKAVPTAESDTPNPGEYVVCAWLQPSASDPAVAAKSTVVQVRQSRAGLTLVPPAAPVRPGSPVTVRFQGTSELARHVYATIKPASGTPPCAAGFNADAGGESFLFWEDVHGAFDFSKAGSAPDKSGTYRVCAWVAEISSDLQPEAAAQTTFTIQSCAQARRAYARAKRALRSARRSLTRARTRRARRGLRSAKRAVSRTRGNVRAACGRR
jgi:hypothetical protein